MSRATPHPHRRPWFRSGPLKTALAALSLTLVILGLGASASAQKPRVLRIGYQKSSSLLLAKLDGQLDKAFRERGVTIEWREFTSGPPLLQGISSAALDVGEVGDAPPVFAQAAGAPLKYIAFAKPSPGSIGIVVKDGSPLKSLKELAGKRVGVAEGTSAHYFLIKALSSAGLGYKDITPVFLQPPEGRAAFENGSVDAWAIWDPFLAAAELGNGASKGRLLTSGQGVVPFYGFYLASQKFLDESPDLVAPFLEQLEQLERRAKADTGKTAKTVATQLGIPLEIATLYEQRKQRYGAKPLTPEVIKSQQEIADLFFAQGLIKRAVVVSEYVWAAGPR
ncbi:MAG: aliphatic sulfonate ABC transporter substrate-binding protein [Polyangiaceae bacterium]